MCIYKYIKKKRKERKKGKKKKKKKKKRKKKKETPPLTSYLQIHSEAIRTCTKSIGQAFHSELTGVIFKNRKSRKQTNVQILLH